MSDPIGRRRWRLMAAALGLLALGAAPASAQQRDRPWFRIYNWDGEVAFDVRNRYDTLKTTDQEPVEKTEWILGEEFIIGADGWVYHPNLLRVSSEIGLEFNQDIVETVPDTGTTEVDLLRVSFDVNLGFLPEKPYPITLFANRSHSEMNPPFSERRTIDALRYGAGMHLRNLAIGEFEIPTRFYYRHFDTETNGRFPNIRKRDEIEFLMRNKTDRTDNRLEYDWESLESDSGVTNRTSERHTVRADHNFYMKDGGQFSSQLLFSSNDANDFQILTTSLNENLNLVHGEKLRSNYGYSFNLQDSESNSQMTHGGFAGVSHQLYESLTSSAVTGVSYSDSDLGSIFRVNGGIGLNYSKKIPGGSFGLRFTPGYSYQDENVKPGILPALDEFHGAEEDPNLYDGFGFELVLDEPCVVKDNTIKVWLAGDPNPLTGERFRVVELFRPEDWDYDSSSSECSGLKIVIDGSVIDDFDESSDPFPGVIVDYQYRVLPARTFTTLVLGTGMSLSLWDHLSFDISYVETRQDLLEGTEEDSTLSDSQLLLTYLDLYFEHNRTRLEFERLRDDISPRDRFSVFHNFSYQPTPRSTLGLGAKYSYDKLTNAKRTTNVFAVTADGSTWFPFGVLARMNMFARYLSQQEQDSLAVGGFLSLAYRYGWLRFELQERLTWNYTKAKRGPRQVTEEFQSDFFFRISRPF